MAGDLFGQATKRRSPRAMMHAVDAGSFPDGEDAARFVCRRCMADTGWIYASRKDVRRGIPCTQCNDKAIGRA